METANKMAKKVRKPTNRGKFGLYLDKTVMESVQKAATKEDRSVNYMVEKALEKEYA